MKVIKNFFLDRLEQFKTYSFILKQIFKIILFWLVE